VDFVHLSSFQNIVFSSNLEFRMMDKVHKPRACHSSGGGRQRPGFEPRSDYVGFVVDKVAPVQVLSEYFGFPCQSFHRLLHIHRHLSSEAGTIGQILVDVPSGLSFTPPQKVYKPTESQIQLGYKRVQWQIFKYIIINLWVSQNRSFLNQMTFSRKTVPMI
jgi:hypothetical protein